MINPSDEPLPELDPETALRAAFKLRGRLLHTSAPMRGSRPHEREAYALEGEIARGGMGVIVKAFDRGLTREVALKLLRDELSFEPRCVQRFFDEARTTARLDHPGIVPVHQAGRDAQGRAWFAMRLVRGRDLGLILSLASANQEGWNQTRALSVMLKVCEAMAYAHERGVIHRDLKPSNVMVGEFGEVYVMDWGLARVLGSADAHDLRLRTPGAARVDAGARSTEVESPIVTMDGEVLGTPCYMAPEQAQGRTGELGPRSDVYSVGAMLYHLLAGEMPYVPAGTSVASRAVLAQLVQGPPRALHTLRRELPAELIAICERAMARDAAERYADMLQMAEDLRAFLEQRVVGAYETGAWAEAKKWVRRNTALACALTAVVAALAVGLVVSLSLKAKSDANVVRANEERRKAEEFGTFLEDTLTGVKPYVALGRDTTVLREMMDGARARIEAGRLANTPEAELRLMLVIGGAYHTLAQYELAEPILRSANEKAERLFQGDHELKARSQWELADVLVSLGKQDSAEPLARSALAMFQRMVPGEDGSIADCTETLGVVQQARGDLKSAEIAMRASLAMRQRLYPADHRVIAVNMHNLAVVLEGLGDLAGAEALHRDALAMFDRLHQGDDPVAAASLDSLGVMLRERGDLAGAELETRRALELRRRLFPGDHIDTASSLVNLAALLAARGDSAGCEAQYREALAMQQRLFKGDHPSLALTISSLAATLHQRGDFDGAEPLYAEALAMQRRLFPGDHPGTPMHLHNLAQLKRVRNDLAGAEALLREALAMQQRLFNGDHPDVARMQQSLGYVLQLRGDLAGSEALYRDALAMRTRVLAGAHPDTARNHFVLARLLELRSEQAGAETSYRDALQMYRALGAGFEARAAQSALGLGRALAAQRRFAAADEALVDAERMLRETPGSTADAKQECVQLLADNCTRWDEAEPGHGHAERAAQWKLQQSGGGQER